MNDSFNFTLIWVLFWIAITMMAINLIEINRGCVECNQFIDGASKGLNAFYDPAGDYYCVWAKDRKPISIKESEGHEYCHYLIDNGKRHHFCDGEKEWGNK